MLLRRPFALIILLRLMTWSESTQAQVLFWSDQFNGGLVTGGYSIGVGTSGSGTFSMPIPAGSTIHWAYLFGTQVGGATQDLTVQLNGTTYTFTAANAVGPVFQSTYGGDAMVHGIDVTNVLDPAITSYTITVPVQTFSVSNVYTEFYLFIAYSNPGLSEVSAVLYLTDQNCQEFHTYALGLPFPVFSSASPVAFASMGGYAANTTADCESISVNGTLLGSYAGGDFNSGSDFGASGAFAYGNGTLTGLGDDLPDQAIAGADVLSDVAALVPDGSTNILVDYQHCPSGSPDDNHIWMMALAYSSDPCESVLDLGPDTTLCVGEPLILDASLPNATYLWQDGTSAATYTVTTAGTYFVHVDLQGCAFDDTIAVSFDAVPDLDLGNDTSVCEGLEVVLSAASVPSGTILWSNGSTSQSIMAQAGTSVSVVVTNGGCSVSDTISIGLIPAPLVDLGPDRSICDGTSAVIAMPPGNATALWSDGSTGPTLSVSTSGLVWGQLTENGCAGRDTVLITVDPLPTVDLGPDQVICVGAAIELDVFLPGATYVWYDGSQGPSHGFGTPADAWVTVTGANGCSASDSIRIDTDDCDLEVVMPNVFSPNSDGDNQVFQAIVLKGVGQVELVLWDRWGLELFRSTDLAFAWNGRVPGGNAVPEGTYFWVLHYTAKQSGLAHELHGTVTLLR
ncbi:MAG: gliding motility-associated C-terminal domain-containing protein [Flavobacteriales bacterium]|nr:gliding motility-associated C-terminal domain-containing protein [Flavobacteriales bacterium]